MNMNLKTVSDPVAYSVTEFCAAHRIARSFFYKLLSDGRGPNTMLLGRRRLITREAAEEWRARLTANTDQDEPA